MIYSIDYSDPRLYGAFGGVGGGGEGALRKMSDETGGHVFKVDRKHTLDQVFKELQDEMRSQYSIGYTPTNDRRTAAIASWISRLANKDLKAQARKGYYAIKPEGAAELRRILRRSSEVSRQSLRQRRHRRERRRAPSWRWRAPNISDGGPGVRYSRSLVG